jgi:opacity protein-like surface antigen
MTKIFLLTCIFLLPFLVFSQETAVKKADSVSAKAGGLYLDASGGLSIPMGYFARDDVKFGGSGFANPGFLAQINLDWTGKSNSGLALQYTFQRNSLKSSVKNDTLSGMSKAVGTGSWTNHYLMVGVVFLNFIHKVYIEGKGMLGVVLSSSPLFSTVDPVYQTPSTNTGIGLAYGAQFGVGYKVSPKVTVKASVEYILGIPKIHHQYGAQPTFDTITGTLVYSAPMTIETKRTVSALLVKAGIVVKLSK